MHHKLQDIRMFFKKKAWDEPIEKVQPYKPDSK
jgi:hypothetical protein